MASKASLLNRASKLGLVEKIDTPLSTNYFEIFEAIRRLGFVVVLKWDGQRSEYEGEGTHTVIISGQLFEENFFRKDDNSLEVAIDEILTEFLDYFEKQAG